MNDSVHQGLKNKLVEAIHFLHAKGWAPATSSNYSFREGGHLFISASGLDKGSFRASDFIEIDALGNSVYDSRKTSAETGLHTLIYRMDPEAKCILHTHSLYSTILSRAHAAEKRVLLEGYEILKGLSGIQTHETSVDIPVFKNSQRIPELADRIEGYWKQDPSLKGFLLESHGLYTWGSSISEAKRHVEVLEFLFECTFKLKQYRVKK